MLSIVGLSGGAVIDSGVELISFEEAHKIAKDHLSTLNISWQSKRQKAFAPTLSWILFILLHPIFWLPKLLSWLRCPQDRLILLNDQTRQVDEGWVFSYQSKRYLQSRDFFWMVLDSCTFLVDGEEGSVHALYGAGISLENRLAAYRKRRSEVTNGND